MRDRSRRAHAWTGRIDTHRAKRVKNRREERRKSREESGEERRDVRHVDGHGAQSDVQVKCAESERYSDTGTWHAHGPTELAIELATELATSNGNRGSSIDGG